MSEKQIREFYDKDFLTIMRENKNESDDDDDSDFVYDSNDVDSKDNDYSLKESEYEEEKYNKGCFTWNRKPAIFCIYVKIWSQYGGCQYRSFYWNIQGRRNRYNG